MPRGFGRHLAGDFVKSLDVDEEECVATSDAPGATECAGDDGPTQRRSNCGAAIAKAADEPSTQASVFADCINAPPEEIVQKKGPVVQETAKKTGPVVQHSNSAASAVPSHTGAATAITSTPERNAHARCGSKLGSKKPTLQKVLPTKKGWLYDRTVRIRQPIHISRWCTIILLLFVVLGVVVLVTSGRKFYATALSNWSPFRGAANLKPEATSSGSSDRAGLGFWGVWTLATPTEPERVEELKNQAELLKKSIQKAKEDLQKAHLRTQELEEQVVLLKESVQKKVVHLEKADVRAEILEEQVVLLKKSVVEKAVDLQKCDAQKQKCKEECPILEVSGLKWKIADATQLSSGRELFNSNLSLALANRTEFTRDEWDAFGIKVLGKDDYIRVLDKTTSVASYFKPAAEESLVEIMYVGAGTMMTSFVGYGLYWFTTQG